MNKPIQFLLYAALCFPLLGQGPPQMGKKSEVINPGWNRDKVKPGMAFALVEENGQFSVIKISLKVRFVKGETEDDDNGYVVSTSLPKSCKVILAWRGIKQIKTNTKVAHVQTPPQPDQYVFKMQHAKVEGYPVEFLVDRVSIEKEKVIVQSSNLQQVVYDSTQLSSGSWWPIWCGDLDGDGKLDFISEEEGGNEYIQGRVVTLWLSSYAKGSEILGIAGKRIVFVSGD